MSAMSDRPPRPAPPFKPLALDPRLRARILAEVGIVDHYAPVDSPLGPVTVAFNDRGISFVSTELHDDRFARRFRDRVADRPLRPASAAPDGVAEALVSGRTVELAVDLRPTTDFQRRVLVACRSIEPGVTRSYRWLAERAGRPGAARAVGAALATNPVPLVIPCHRVVRANGRPGGYVLGPDRKEQLLHHEAQAAASSPTGRYHLAQLNIARFHHPMDHPDLAEFVAMLDPLNALAESSPGFVWRLTGEGANNAVDIHYYDDPRLLVNMSVWTDLDSLRNYVYRSAHVDMYRRRRQWADAMDDAHLVLWWIREGHIPDLAEADARLERLRSEGPSPEAFTFGSPFPAPTGQPAS